MEITNILYSQILRDRLTFVFGIHWRLLFSIARSKVNTEDFGDSGSELLGVEGAVAGSLSKTLRSFSEHHHPGVLRTLGAGAVACESALVPPAMISCHQVGGFPFVERIALAIFHYSADHLIRIMGGVKIEIILIGMSPLVSVAKSDEDHFRMVFLDSLQGIGIGKSVKTLFSPVMRHHILHIVYQFQRRSLGRGDVRLIGRASRETSPLVVDSVAD